MLFYSRFQIFGIPAAFVAFLLVSWRDSGCSVCRIKLFLYCLRLDSAVHFEGRFQVVHLHLGVPI